MTATVQPEGGRIVATPAAREAVKRLCAARGGPVMFVQSAGCCAGSVPMCFPAGEFITGVHDLLLGEIEGCPFYIGSALNTAWNSPDLVLDVTDGEPEGFSLGPGSGQRFITRAAGIGAGSMSMNRSAEPARAEPDLVALEDRIRQLEAQMEALIEAVEVLARGLERGPMDEPQNTRTEEAARRTHELLLLAKSAPPNPSAGRGT